MKTVINFLGEGTKKLNEQNRAYGVLREPKSLELLTEDGIYSLSDMKACKILQVEYNRDENQR